MKLDGESSLQEEK